CLNFEPHLNSMTVYGIPNCDTIKKTTDWLKKNKIDFSFHDYKKEGITKAKLATWSEKVGWETILSKKSTTWRELSAEEQAKIKSQSAAIKVMMENNSIIKRPVIEAGDKLLVGFNEEQFIKQLK
ncbi:MAG: ArsC family reductase, partial [Bacteroidota bacterium]